MTHQNLVPGDIRPINPQMTAGDPRHHILILDYPTFELDRTDPDPKILPLAT